MSFPPPPQIQRVVHAADVPRQRLERLSAKPARRQPSRQGPKPAMLLEEQKRGNSRDDETAAGGPKKFYR